MPSFVNGVRLTGKLNCALPTRECKQCGLRWVPSIKEHAPYVCPVCRATGLWTRWIKIK
jgi:hypothetical protein